MKKPVLKDLALCLLSFFLLLLAFPKFDLWILAWIGLIPFFLNLEGKSPLKAFGSGYLLGILFFGGTLWWLVHVTWPGAILMVLFLALYFAVFGLGYAWLSKKSKLQRLFMIPSLWVVLEFARDHLLTGFGWVSLAYSQYKNIWIIQISEITGYLGVSFLIVMVNFYIFQTVKEKRIHTQSTFVVLVVLIASLGHGLYHIDRLKGEQTMKVAIVQGNIEQEDKWRKSQWPGILKKYKSLTLKVKDENPDLVIWPETAYPGFAWERPELFEDLRAFVKNFNKPFLVGAVTYLDENYYNSALLLSSRGRVIKQYDKVHLVPFGEFVPLRGAFPFLANIIPIDDFTPGQDHTVFDIVKIQNLEIQKGKFSVLICFEDTIARVARKFVQAGAQVLVNITNDAWFKDTKAPYMHLQAAVFRAVENRRPLIRAANTGVSCFIDQFGRITGYLEGPDSQKTFVDGFAVKEAALIKQETLYTKFGDIFTYLCFGCILWGTLINRINKNS